MRSYIFKHNCMHWFPVFLRTRLSIDRNLLQQGNTTYPAWINTNRRLTVSIWNICCIQYYFLLNNKNRILLCNKQEKIYCLQHNIIKFITLLLPCNGVSLKIILITLKPNLLEVVMYIHVCKLNFLHRGNIFHT